MDSDRYTQITNRHTIADTFVHLTYRNDEVTLQFEHSPVRYPVSVMTVDRALGQCRLQMVEIDDVRAALDAGRAFVLHSRQPTGTTSTVPMCALATQSRPEDDMRIRCALPRALALSRHRHEFRAALPSSMDVAITLYADDGREYSGRLCNLSVSGSLLRLQGQLAQALPTRNQAYRLSACFPSGDNLDVPGQVRRVYQPAHSRCVYVAIAFEHDVIDARPRSPWFYVREIQREATRVECPGDPLHRRAPSVVPEVSLTQTYAPDSVRQAKTG